MIEIGVISVLVLPTLLQDIVDRADKWGNGGETGRIDPFTEVYDVSPFVALRFWTGAELSLALSARFRHDCPYDHMSRPDKERS